MSNDIYNYCLVFQKDCEGKGWFVFAIEKEEVAIQFCKDHKGYYYITRQRWEKLKDE